MISLRNKNEKLSNILGYHWSKYGVSQYFTFFPFSGFDLKSYRQSLTKWNAAISAMNEQCESLGPDYCLKVYYEQLILHPRKWLQKILKFLNLPWTENVMHHEKQINKPHGISLSKVERSSDQVTRCFIHDKSDASDV